MKFNLGWLLVQFMITLYDKFKVEIQVEFDKQTIIYVL